METLNSGVNTAWQWTIWNCSLFSWVWPTESRYVPYWAICCRGSRIRSRSFSYSLDYLSAYISEAEKRSLNIVYCYQVHTLLILSWTMSLWKLFIITPSEMSYFQLHRPLGGLLWPQLRHSPGGDFSNLFLGDSHYQYAGKRALVWSIEFQGGIASLEFQFFQGHLICYSL